MLYRIQSLDSFVMSSSKPKGPSNPTKASGVWPALLPTSACCSDLYNTLVLMPYISAIS